MSIIRTPGNLNNRYNVSESVLRYFVASETTNWQPLRVLVFSNLSRFEVDRHGRQVWLYTHIDGIEVLTTFFMEWQE